MTLSIKINGKNVYPQYNGDRSPKPDGYPEACRACNSFENAHIMSCLKVQLTDRRRELAPATKPAPKKVRNLPKQKRGMRFVCGKLTGRARPFWRATHCY